MKTTFLLTLVALLTLLANASRAGAQGTDFTYQGRLFENGAPANNRFDLQFLIYDALDGGIQQGVTLVRLGLEAGNGLFTTTLDFGPGIFTGPRRWLEIRVAAVNTSAFTTLRPRQALTPTPYAIYAPEAGTAATASRVAWTALTGIPPGLADGVDDNTTYVAGSGLTLAGQSLSLNTAVTDARYWKLAGNSGTTAGVNFLGTMDDQALELKVNGSRTLRLEPGANSPNLIGGYRGNAVAAGVEGATIAGGGTLNFAGFTYTNRVDANFGTVGGGLANAVAGIGAAVGGGRANAIESSADYSVIAGGFSHRVETNADYATISGGFDNTIRTNAESSTISGGRDNVVQAGSIRTTIGGGWNNVIETNAHYATVSGGARNAASGVSSTIGGGTNNLIQGHAVSATIGGGQGNTIQPNAAYATSGGGFKNQAGGLAATVAGGAGGSATNDYATVGGGQGNVAGGQALAFGTIPVGVATHATVGGGSSNRAQRTFATVGGGEKNSVANLHSTIGGGFSNVITGVDFPDLGFGTNCCEGVANTIGGGSGNYIRNLLIQPFASYSTIGGGRDNTILGHGSVVAGGANNFARGSFASISGGISNRAAGAFSSVSGGISNSVGGYATTIVGGEGNVATSTYAAVLGGAGAAASQYGQIAHASGRFVNTGDAQASESVLRQITTDATPREMFLDGSDQRMEIPANGAWTFDILIVARSSGASVGGYQIRGVIKHNALGLTIFIGTPSVTTLGEQVAGWDVAVEADDGNDALAIKVTGSATTVRWVATVRTVEVKF